MGIKVLENLLTKTAKPNVLDGLLTYRSSNKELKDVINHRIYTENPELFHGKYDGALLGEGEYNIIQQDVPTNNLWWDGNDINEWGYDTGSGIARQQRDQQASLLKELWQLANGAK